MKEISLKINLMITDLLEEKERACISGNLDCETVCETTIENLQDILHWIAQKIGYKNVLYTKVETYNKYLGNCVSRDELL